MMLSKISRRFLTSNLTNQHKITPLLLRPHPNVANPDPTNIYIFDKATLNNTSELPYFHESYEPIGMSGTKIRLISTYNTIAASYLKRDKIDFKHVIENWNIFRFALEEAGSINAKYAHYVEDVASLKYSDLLPSAKAVVKQIAETEKGFFKRKYVEWNEMKKRSQKIEQNKLWPSELKRLLSQPYNVVDYALRKLGYDLKTMIEELNEKGKIKMSKDEAKIKILKSLAATDIDTINANIDEFLQDVETFCKYDKIIDVKEFQKNLNKLINSKKIKNLKKELSFSKTTSQANKIKKQILDPIFQFIKTPALKIIKEADKYGYIAIERDNLYNKYSSSLKRGKIFDPLKIYKYFIIDDREYPLTRLVSVIYLILFAISYITYKVIDYRYYKKTGLIVGHRSSYYNRPNPPKD